ncbi:MAG: hypothetical protein VSS75_027250 [Candidatus Parabeggiatoa sp.]|nr:hypothetical protein [Candidatus Parabeggiatoa sp.]
MAKDVGNDKLLGANSWSLLSADGWNKVTGTFIRKWMSLEDDVLLLTDISITGDFWQRDKEEVNDAKITLDFRVQLPQVIIKENALKELIIEIDKWFSEPREIGIELSNVCYQSFQITFGMKDEFICSPDKPVCTIQYSSDSRMKMGEWNFVVDQSCLRLFRDDLNLILKQA